MSSVKQNFDLNQYIKGILSGERATLSRAITLRESSLSEHKLQSKKLLKSLLKHTGNSIRIGITGIPGAGKSTFIDVFGSYLIEKFNKKVAVLAVDPSSQKNQGSILGDKTRMEHLSRQESAFIRPSPNKTLLGGVNQHTRESMLFCEAAGYDIILIETVGVGQSETEVNEMVDFLIMLQIVGGGDDLQAIKRGVYEKIDLLLIHKADQNNKIEAEVEKENFFKKGFWMVSQGSNLFFN
jgi:LAO/AO transport system kinase